MEQRDDSRLMARALQAARRAAGLRTAEAAAAHFGWPVARYRAHESGAREISDDDFARYAQAFRVSWRALRQPDRLKIESQLSDLREQDRLISKRLRCARILRGHQSARQAAVFAGVKIPTFLKHENGDNRISDELAEVYAQAFAVSSPWILTGALPSGLGPLLDRKMAAVVRSPERYLPQAEPGLASASAGEPLDLKAGRLKNRSATVPEYRWSEIEMHRADLAAVVPHGIAALPMLPSEGVASNTFFVVVDVTSAQHPFLTRVLISPTFTDNGDVLFYDGRQLGICKAEALRSSDLRILGRVVGKIEPLT